MPLSSRSPMLLAALLWSACLLGLPSAAIANDADAAFREGLAAYRADDFEAARDAFRRARDAGHGDPNVHFNLGLSHLQLGAWDAARDCFESLREVPSHRAVALYHLALLAARNGQQDLALHHLAAAEQAATSPAIRARVRLARARIAPRYETADGALHYLYLGGGHDGNPSLIRENDDLPRLSADRHYVEALAAGQWKPASRHHLDATLFARSYPGGDRYDQLGAQLQWRLRDHDAAHSTALAVEINQLDQNVQQQLIHLERLMEYADGPTHWNLRTQLSGIHATRDFALLSGWRLRSNARASRPMGPGRGFADLELAFNERRDLNVSGAFFSQSPIRAALQMGYRHEPTAGLTLQWQGEYRHSYFRHQDRIPTDDGSLSIARRRDDLWSIRLQARHRLTARLHLVGEARYDDNRSTQSLFDYHRPRFSAGLEWQP